MTGESQCKGKCQLRSEFIFDSTRQAVPPVLGKKKKKKKSQIPEIGEKNQIKAKKKKH